MRKNKKIKLGWEAYSTPKQRQRKKLKLKKTNSWITNYEVFYNKKSSLFEIIVKFLIRISLYFTITKQKFLNETKRKDLVDKAYNTLSSNHFAFVPAGVGLYLFISFIPITILTIGIISLNKEWQVILNNQIIEKILPGFSSIITTIKLNNSFWQNTLLLIFILSSLWFASKGISKFLDSVNYIYDFKLNTNWFLKRIKSICLVILASLFFSFALATYVPLIGVIYNNYHTNDTLYNFIFYFTTFFYLLFWGYIGIGLIFKIVPSFKLKWNQIHPGIFITLVPACIFILTFGIIANYLNYEKFGLIGTFLYALFFVLYISYFIYAGLIINASYYHTYCYINLQSKKYILKTEKILFNVSTKAQQWFNFKNKKG